MLSVAASAALGQTCSGNWTVLNGKCSQRFGLEDADRISWQAAEDTCVSLGGHLASVATVRELQALAAFCFDGLSGTNYKTDCAVGLYRTEDTGRATKVNNWVWTDGSPWTAEMDAEDQATCCTHISQHKKNKMHIEGHYGTYGMLEGDYSDGAGPFMYVCQLAEAAASPPPVQKPETNGICLPVEIPNSDRNLSNPCVDTSTPLSIGSVPAPSGFECKFTCNEGYFPVGRHVCQWHDIGFNIDRNDSDPEAFYKRPVDGLNYQFYGGRCERICEGSPVCLANNKGIQRAGRVPSADAAGGCFRTKCFDNTTGLENLLRGVYHIFGLGRDVATGFYKDSVNLYGDEEDERYSLDATGTGMMAEVVGAALGYQSASDALAKVTQTVDSLLSASNTSGSFMRDSRGYFTHFTGLQNAWAWQDDRPSRKLGRAQHSRRSQFLMSIANSPDGVYASTMATGLVVSSALFAKKYLLELPELLADSAAEEFGYKVDELFESVDFTSILCDEKTNRLSPEGTGIPMVVSVKGDYCGTFNNYSTQYPQWDNMYQFSEMHNALHLAYEQACGDQTPGACDNTAIELAWNRWKARRFKPMTHYKNYTIQSTWGSYIFQLPYYTTSAYNNDTVYKKLFKQDWLADEMYFKQVMHAGNRGRYGLGEGPNEAWCNEGKEYDATNMLNVTGQLTPGKRNGLHNGNRMYCNPFSANIVAGYLPADPQHIKRQLLSLYEDGETVYEIVNTSYDILWRASLSAPYLFRTGKSARFTLVDLAPELFGLSTLYLPTKFYQTYSSHFDHDGLFSGPITPEGLKAKAHKLQGTADKMSRVARLRAKHASERAERAQRKRRLQSHGLKDRAVASTKGRAKTSTWSAPAPKPNQQPKHQTPQKAADAAKAAPKPQHSRERKEHALGKRLQQVTRRLKKLKPDNTLSPKHAELYAPSDIQPAHSTWSAPAPKTGSAAAPKQ